MKRRVTNTPPVGDRGGNERVVLGIGAPRAAGRGEGMQQIFSTDNVEPQERFDFFLEELCKVARLAARRVDSDQVFDASIQVAPLARTMLMVTEISDCETMRGKSEIDSSDTDTVHFCLQLAGSVPSVTDGQEVVLRPGDVWIYDPRTPFHQGHNNIRSLTWGVPRALLEAKMGPIEPLSMRKLHHSAPAAGLAATMLGALPKHCASLGPAAAAHVESSLLDLLTVAYLGDEHSPAATKSYMQMAARFRLKSIIETYLFDARLKPTDFAEMAGMTTRYANMLLASDGTRLERYIFERRLERSRAVLDNPTLDFRSLSEIAYSHGFTNLSHFSKRFKEQYGVTPSEYRQHRSGTTSTN